MGERHRVGVFKLGSWERLEDKDAFHVQWPSVGPAMDSAVPRGVGGWKDCSPPHAAQAKPDKGRDGGSGVGWGGGHFRNLQSR